MSGYSIYIEPLVPARLSDQAAFFRIPAGDIEDTMHLRLKEVHANASCHRQEVSGVGRLREFRHTGRSS